MAIDKKLKAIIYNVKERDAHSVGVKDDGEYLERGQCQYVFGGPDQSDWFHCGHETVGREVYCEEHFELCYRGKQAKKKLKELLPS